MKRWSSAALPISILLVLAALTFWLRYATEFTEKPGDGKHRHDPDYIVDGVSLRKIGQSGILEHTLIADQIRHYPDDDTTSMDQPKFVYLHPTRPPVTISAVHGVMGPKGERVDLSEQVEVRRAGSAKNPPLLVETSELTVLTGEEKAFTNSHVLITQGASWVQGVGMQVDNKLQTYLLESQVRGEIESRSAKKKKPQT
ncbi:MAG: Lipopolysaccharide-assembly protein [Candidatus Accumulibacter appositus]|mgnify:CR=1 FL=1|uniref:Lipopolysaccharide-assembly protein n=1 Tax=Candidatus Accumulibacter appositus TaxID=1454003 RepID=A0A011NGK2_9PROT|nr:LPS export ABC transporter periplasmic protein LptC [Accumulibacter sp.]EXI81853.1 MAG: Lipopolysaccharide-assembly protein [Candidatus Accumulibacter appositus]HRF04335.1 LPS export ABC transporter periplasmic protein LptC [Accumulibacter sp.]